MALAPSTDKPRARRIDALSADQSAMLEQIRDEWIAVGLQTGPADRPAAEAGVRAAYRRAGLEPPGQMLWLDSPIAGCFAAATLVRGQVSDQVRDQVWGQVLDQVRDQVRDQVSDQVRGQVRGQVWDQVRGQVRDQVSGQVWGQVSGQVRDQVWAAIPGQHDAGWLSWAAALRRIGVDCDTTGLQAVAQNAGWWWAFRGVAILTERPTAVHRDSQGRLHNPVGPALQYPDGWGFHAWHGTRVPADLIETGWSIEESLRAPNLEVRRCAIEIAAGREGWTRIIRQARWSQVGSDAADELRMVAD